MNNPQKTTAELMQWLDYYIEHRHAAYKYGQKALAESEAVS